MQLLLPFEEAPTSDEARLARDLAYTHKRLVMLRCVLDKIRKMSEHEDYRIPAETARLTLQLIEIEARTALTLDTLSDKTGE